MRDTDVTDTFRGPNGRPMDDEGAADGGDVTETDYEEAEKMDEALTDDPAYDPAVQAPKEAER